MNDTEFGERVAVMLRERAQDIVLRPAPALATAPPVQLHPEAPPRRRGWLVAAAVLAIVACGALVALARQNDDGRVDTVPAEEAPSSASTEVRAREGWTPFAPRPAMPGFEVPPPDRAWLSPEFGNSPHCDRPPSIPASVNLQCIYGEPGGEVTGYFMHDLGFVPVDRLDEFDVNQAYIDQWGCSPLLDETCELRHQIELERLYVERAELSPATRARHEQTIEQLEQELRTLQADR